MTRDVRTCGRKYGWSKLVAATSCILVATFMVGEMYLSWSRHVKADSMLLSNEQASPIEGRARLLQEMCYRHNRTFTAPRLRFDHLNEYRYRSRRLVYCSLPKVGTIFIRQLLSTLQFDPPPRGLYSSAVNKYDNFMRLIFVRDPFSRLLSAYLNKFFSVHHYWVYYGKLMAKLSRRASCGHDVTFREFVKYVVRSIKTNHHANEHWYPMSGQCLPCDMRYNFIGKLETAERDMKILVEVTGVTLRHTLREQYRNSTLTRLVEAISRAFLKSRCLSVKQGLERVWKDSQIKGIIDHRTEFPRASGRRGYNQSDFTKLVMDIQSEYVITARDKAAIKTVTLRTAYNMVDREDIDKLRRLFRADFLLFGYDMYPAYLTDNGPLNYHGWRPFKLVL